MLEIDGLTVTVRRSPVLRGIDMRVPSGCLAGLVGRNGAGKTTTLRSIMGLIRVQGGSVTLDDVDLLRTKSHDRARLGVGYVPEDRRLIPAMSVEQNLLLPAWANGTTGAGQRLKRIYELMPEVGELALRRATQLSGGQQKLVALARALMVGRRALLLDEPFEGLAPALAQRMGDALRAVQEQENMSMILAESELRHVTRLAHRVYTIERGEIVQFSESDGAVEPENHERGAARGR
ncbi:MAG: ABC transporter ATP-binding protein [Actinomycetota bacterium]